MRLVKVKRLVYSYDPNMAHIDAYGGIEYNSTLSDKCILDSLYEPGNWEWSPYWKNMLVRHCMNYSLYMQVRTFCYYEKTWVDKVIDNVRRLLRL